METHFIGADQIKACFLVVILFPFVISILSALLVAFAAKLIIYFGYSKPALKFI